MDGDFPESNHWKLRVASPPDAQTFPGFSSGGALRGAARYAAGCISLELEFRAHL